MSFRNTYGDQAAVIGPWTGQLSNSSETINLRDATDRRVDRVTYADEGDWAQRVLGDPALSERWIWADDHDGGGKSLELVNAEMPKRIRAELACERCRFRNSRTREFSCCGGKPLRSLSKPNTHQLFHSLTMPLSYQRVFWMKRPRILSFS